jgi:hypothetical protein
MTGAASATRIRYEIASSDLYKNVTCFHELARFKRIVKIEMSDANAGAAVRKVGYVDLIKIRDPNETASRSPTAC